MRINYSTKLFSPLFWHLLPLLRDERIRYIFIEGGSSAAKTHTICQALMIDQYENEYSTVVFRRQGVDIKDSIYSSFKSVASQLELSDYYVFQEHLIKGNDEKARVRFRGLDNEENIKGIEGFTVVYNNEWNQFLERHFDQQRKRLRGRKNQKFICDWNPVSAKLWIYENWIDRDTWHDLPLFMDNAPVRREWTQLDPEFAFKRINAKGDSIWIKVTYRDNFWVVGHPSGKGGYVDQHTLDDFEKDRMFKPNMYRIYANGERGIMRTGGEFWKQFDETKHVKPVQLNPKEPLHITLDENVNPYVTCLMWQIAGKQITQVNEILAKSPENNAPKAARLLVKVLDNQKFESIIYVYGDPSAGKRSTVDANNASFYDKYIAELRAAGFHVVSKVERSAPEVQLSAAFINDIYQFGLDGWEIVIGDNCKVSVDDYATVKEDQEGKMHKAKEKDAAGITYEPNGHCSDAKRYFLTTFLKAEFIQYKSRNARRNKGGIILADR